MRIETQAKIGLAGTLVLILVIAVLWDREASRPVTAAVASPAITTPITITIDGKKQADGEILSRLFSVLLRDCDVVGETIVVKTTTKEISEKEGVTVKVSSIVTVDGKTAEGFGQGYWSSANGGRDEARESAIVASWDDAVGNFADRQK